MPAPVSFLIPVADALTERLVGPVDLSWLIRLVREFRVDRLQDGLLVTGDGGGECLLGPVDRDGR